MGSQESTIANNSSSVTSANKKPSFTFEKELQDPRYGGTVTIVRRSKNSRPHVLIKKKVNSSLALERELKFLNKRMIFPNPNLLKIDSYKQKDEQSCCNIEWTIDIYVEYLENDLQKELAEKRKANANYQEHELIYLIENLTQGLYSLEKAQVPSPNISPANVLIDSFGAYKFVDLHLINFKPESFSSSSYKKLLAPEDLEEVKPKLETPRAKVDVFSLGMTILEAATLEPSSEIYDYEKRKINEQLLEERLNQLKSKYSPDLCLLIASMLKLNSQERADLQTVCEKLSELGDSLVNNGANKSFALDRVQADHDTTSMDRGSPKRREEFRKSPSPTQRLLKEISH